MSLSPAPKPSQAADEREAQALDGGLSTTPDLQLALEHHVLRAALWSVLLVSALGMGSAYYFLPLQVPESMRLLMMGGYAALFIAGCVGLRLPLERSSQMLGPLVFCALLLVAAVAWLSGWGLQTPGLSFYALAVTLTNAVGQPRRGLISTASALGVMVALAMAERAGVLATPPDLPPLASRLFIQCSAVMVGTLGGRAMAALIRQHITAARHRANRFGALLGIAASSYWELDTQWRFTHATRHSKRAGGFVLVPELQGRLPWDMQHVDWEGPDQVASLKATLATRAPLRDLAFTWRHGGGHTRHYLASGEPRFDDQGHFAGYWGVARDVTSQHLAQRALAATELRYQELFQRIPTPLALHRNGVVLDANLAAAHMLGYESVEPLLGQNLVEAHVAPALREPMRQLIKASEDVPVGQQFPSTDLALHTRQGRELIVKVLGARTLARGEPATLLSGTDETDRREAARALQRSQTLLSRVVSTSPDIITLSRASTGQYVMVNPSFTRMLGYTSEEAVGRTTTELRLWPDEQTWNAVLESIARQGGMQDQRVDFVAKGGRTLPLMLSLSRFENDGHTYVLANARDISESRRVELQREAILAHAPVGIALTRHRRVVWANAQVETMFGWPVGTLAGRPTSELWHHGDDYARLNEELGPALSRGDAVDQARRATRLDGSTFDVRFRGKAIDPHNPDDGGTLWICEDVTSARQNALELARARDAAEAANRAKSAFLANTSHEIRTPLNGLLGLARLARQPGLPQGRLNQYIEQIGESAEVLSMIISDILDLSKIEAGKLQLESTTFDLSALLHTLVQAYAPLASSHGLQFTVQLDEGLPTVVRGDALRVRQILVNYLQNALKFTHQGGLHLTASRRPADRVRFEVHDTGLGIAAGTQARLFEPFTQADDSTTRRFGGTGLGLSICRELATLMGGEVGLQSSLGRGSCFYAELPLPAATGAADTITLVGPQDTQLQGLRVMLVEDNAVNMMIAEALLAQWGVLVTQAVDGPQALGLLAQATAAGPRFDAVLMDVQMPGMSGYETTAALRQTHSAAALPVIALTAAALVSERQRAADVGMTDFLTKPIDPQRLHAALLRVREQISRA